MYIKILNIIMILLVISFLFLIFNYYSSNKNMNEKEYNRQNIDEIMKEKISDLPLLLNDTNDVIEFNNSLEDNTNEKKRGFWNLLKYKWN